MAKLLEKGDSVPLVDISPQSKQGMTAAKRAFYIAQISDALAVSLLRDVQGFARLRVVPNAMNPKRLVWERVRSSLIDNFVRLFQLDKESSDGDGWATKPAVVIDVPSNAQAVSNAEDKTKQPE